MLAPYAEVRLYFPVNGITYRFTCIAGAYYATKRPDIAHKLARMSPKKLDEYIHQLSLPQFSADERANLLQEILEAACAQNPHERKWLLAQYDPIEFFGNDYFWYIQDSGRGINMYGKVLTTVKRKLERSRT